MLYAALIRSGDVRANSDTRACFREGALSFVVAPSFYSRQV